MPTIHWQPMAMTEGMKGCGACHKVGLKTPQEMKDLRQTSGGYGVASCDACHTRHTFSKKEAQQPQACETCHMGFDHPQWEMYSGSKHGVRALLKQTGTLPNVTPAPTSYAFPDLLTFHDAPTVIEQKLFVMFLEHRMRTLQGTFHANPDYALWYGWSEMQRDLTEIKALAADLRDKPKRSEK
jgi:hypothetical protein